MIITAFLCTILLHTVAIWIFPHIGMVDFPKRYGHERKPIPYPTGILSIIVFLSAYCALSTGTMQEIGLCIGICLLGVTCFIDDRLQTPAWLRLIVQGGVATLIFATGSRIYTLTNPAEIIGMAEIIKLDTVDIPTKTFGPLPLYSGIFTVAWLMLTMNALNWFDGIPGQVHLLSTIGFCTIGLLSISDRVNQPELALIAFILAAIAFGALFFDFPKPLGLSGDSGAMFFGLMLGVLTIYSGGKVATAFLVLGVPLIDVGLVLIHRIRKGANPLIGNTTNEHLHHRLLAKGWSPQRILTVTAALGACFGISALFLNTIQKMLAVLILFSVMLMLTQYSKNTND